MTQSSLVAVPDGDVLVGSCCSMILVVLNSMVKQNCRVRDKDTIARDRTLILRTGCPLGGGLSRPNANSVLLGAPWFLVLIPGAHVLNALLLYARSNFFFSFFCPSVEPFDP